MQVEGTTSILDTLANLKMEESPSKNTGKKSLIITLTKVGFNQISCFATDLPDSKSMQLFNSPTWTEKSLQRYQHNYENIYSELNDKKSETPVYENVYFGPEKLDQLVVGEMSHSPRTAPKLMHHSDSEWDSVDSTTPLLPPQPNVGATPNNSATVNPHKRLYRSKSCDRHKMRDTVRDSLKANSDMLQDSVRKFYPDIDRLSCNVSDKATVFYKSWSSSSSSHMSTLSSDVSSCTSQFESTNSILQTVALKVIPCVDIQVREAFFHTQEKIHENSYLQ